MRSPPARLFLIGSIAWAFAVTASAQTPSHNWTLQIGSSTFGIVGFGDHTYLCYGFGYQVLPFPPENVSLAILGLLILAVLTVLFAAFRSNRRSPSELESRGD